MAIADRAATPVVVANINIFCHVATLFWAACEARGVPTNTVLGLTILQNIVGQGDLYGLLHSLPYEGTWDFRITKTTPPRDKVLLWCGITNHSAVVIGANAIAGHNQGHQFNYVRNINYCIKSPHDIVPERAVVRVIDGQTVVNRAAHLNL